jgi:hypothetical protein
MAQINATIPRDLKVQLFVILAARNLKFTTWLMQQMHKEVREHLRRAVAPMQLRD